MIRTTSGNPRNDGPGLRLRRALAERFYASLPYRLSLAWRRPEGIALVPVDPWPGQAAQADRMLQGRFHFAGEEIHSPGNLPWTKACPSAAWAVELHSFSWLRHFRAAGGDTARRQARALVAAWIADHGHWSSLAWRADILGRRLVAWLSHSDFLDNGFVKSVEKLSWDATFLAALADQAIHLAAAAPLAPPGAPRLRAALAAGCVALSMTDGQRRWPKAVMLLQAEIDRQILADGGHVSRNPSLVMTLLRDLIALRDLCRQAAVPPPPAVTQAIDRMAPMLRFFRHGDGGLALFHGGGEEAPEAVELTLALAEADGKPIASAVHSGFERLAAGQALVLLDTGLPPTRPGGARPHFGLLAFEFSSGGDRIVVNCGALESPEGKWARALSATAAHSTLTLADTNALDPDMPDWRLPQPRVERSEQDSNIWLTASHDGYADKFRFSHRRRLYLAADGEDLRGEDALVGYGASRKTPFALRFHLHPGTHVSLLQNGAEALLKSAGGQGWRFRVAGPVGTGLAGLGLADSVYFGQGAMRRCQQLVITGEASHGGATIKWAFAKLVAAGR